MTARPIVSQAEFARLRGVSRKTVTLWKRQERLALTADGKVDVEATEKLLALRPETYRGGTAKAKPAKKIAEGLTEALAIAKGEKKPAKLHIPSEDVEPADEAVPILDRTPEWIASSSNWTLVEAQRVKEVYLALLRKQEFEVEEGLLVEIEAVAHEVEREYSIVRERLLSIPGKVSASLVGCDRPVIEARLLDESAALTVISRTAWPVIAAGRSPLVCSNAF